MSIDSDPSEALYDVVENMEGQHSIWPAGRSLPEGWSRVGTQGTKATCLAYIEDAWTDMRPRSLATDRRG
jgi:MbtH protein